jgi:hypothetical protein
VKPELSIEQRAGLQALDSAFGHLIARPGSCDEEVALIEQLRRYVEGGHASTSDRSERRKGLEVRLGEANPEIGRTSGYIGQDGLLHAERRAQATLCARCNQSATALRRDCHQCAAILCDMDCMDWHLEKDCRGIDGGGI